MSSIDSPTSSTTGGWLGSLEKSNGNGNGNGRDLWQLPDTLTDPFTSLSQRLAATLDSYRFSTEPRSLIDWAVVQTGLDDPLSKYTRHELEQAFPRFARDRTQHLHKLIQTIKREGQRNVLLQAAAESRHPEAQAALKRSIGH